MYKALRHQTLPDACASQLRRMILAGEFAPGDRLPPERELADRFDVNRVTLRSALARLAASGLVEVRQGRGYTVRDYRSVGGPDLLPGLAELARERGEMVVVAADLFLVRRHLAAAVLQRLAERPPADISGVAAAVSAFAALAAARAHPDDLAEADADILAALLAATESPVLQLCLNPIRAVMAELPELRVAMYRDPGGNVLGWQALLAWLAAPDLSGVADIAALLAARDADTIAALEPS